MEPTGTTIATLQCYLDAGIAVQSIDYGNIYNLQGRREQLTGLVAGAAYPVLVGDKQEGWPLNLCLPCLYDFSALCAPLPNGEVPAINAMKGLPFGEEIDWERAKAKLYTPAPHRDPASQIIHLFAPVVGLDFGIALMLSNRWSLSGGEPTWERLYLNALLKQHAAVGLDSTAYIPL